MARVRLLGVWLVCLGGTAFTLLRMLFCVASAPQKAKDIAVALDRAGNAAINGSNQETISSRANRARTEGRRWGCLLCRILDALSPNHCRNSAGK
jgi:hypothetical protein